MDAKLKSIALTGQHTAGIFSDMSVDGPLIGTLVLVVDRAKNLPNRKTIGKQDPYCAARLGKEAKKTTTDIRGGQTPRWDQELRFTVHDSPDYYQLKVSVFNDDKKTELIGEAWIDLRDIIVPGGGQNDLWHQLSCRGKYAGDIRIEITFYDSRPKPEKPVVKAKPPVSSDLDGARQTQRPAGPKRRPLPTDPVTGKTAPSQPLLEPVAQTPPRPQPSQSVSYIPNQSPLQQVEYNTPPVGAARYQQDQYSPSAAAGSTYGSPGQQMDLANQQYRTPERNDIYRGHPDDRHTSPNMHFPMTDRQYQRPPQDYDSRYQVDERGVSPEDDRPPPPPVHRSRHNSGAAHEQMLIRNGYDSLLPKGTPPTIRQEVLRNEAHRHSQSMSGTYPGRPTYKPYDSAPATPNGQQYSPLESNQASAPRHHSYDSSYDSHRSMQPTVEDVPESPDAFSVSSFRKSASRAPQYESGYEQSYDSVSPAPLNLSGRGSAASNYQYSPSPTQDEHLRRSSFTQQESPSMHPSRDHRAQEDYRREPPPDFYNDRGQPLLSYHNELDDTSGSYGMPPVPSSLVPGVDPGLAMEVSRRINEDRRNERRYTQPAMASSPADRDRQMMAGPSDYSAGSPSAAYGSSSQQSRGRSSQNYSAPPDYHSQEHAPNYSPNPNRNPSPNPHHTIKRKSISPAPPRSADEGRRLSGVPFGPDSYNALNPSVAAPSPKETGGAMSDYNETNGMIITHDGREVDPSDHLPMDTWAPEPEPKKPSAAPSPSSRPSPGGPQSLPASGRRPLRVAGRAQTMMSSAEPGYISPDVSFGSPTPKTPASAGRNRLQKKAHRASAMPVMSGANGDGASPGYHHQASSPLAPLPMHQDNFTPPRNLSRAQTFDFANENHAPAAYAGSPSIDGYDRHHSRGGSADGRGFRSSMGGPPPIPAKVPLALPSSVSHAPSSRPYDEWGGMQGGGSGSELALMEEMRRIDIGTGRARRHGQSYGY